MAETQSRPWHRTPLWGAGVLVLVGVAALVHARHTAATGPECIDVWGEARYKNIGYDHIVHINNRCNDTAICDVSTNVNPVAIRVTVAPKQAVEVLTFRGSPAREFTPRADCRFQP